jgi:hypothetical protein
MEASSIDQTSRLPISSANFLKQLSRRTQLTRDSF